MKKIKVKNLKQQLLAVSKIVKRNAVLPIMESVKIGGGLLIGTDNNTHVKMPFECEGPEVMVELVLLREIIRKCKLDVLCFESNGKALLISSPDSNFKCSLTSSGAVEEFPVIDWSEQPEIEDGDLSQLQRTYFPPKVSEAITTAFSYISKDDLRPIMCGVLLCNNAVVATDAHKLYTKNFDYALPKFDVNNPGAVITEKVVKLFNVLSGGFLFSITKTNLVIEFEETHIVSGLCDVVAL